MSDQPGRYRKLYPRIWRHPGYRGLTPTGRELALYPITGPQTNRIGLFHFSIATAAEDLGTTAETLRGRLVDVAEAFGWLHDAVARVLFIPSWWRWNPPENENVLKGNLKDLNDVPPCALVDAFAKNIGTLDKTLHATFVETLRTRLPKRQPIQDQNQHLSGSKQEQEREQHGNDGPRHSNGRLLPIAREAIRTTDPNAEMDHLLDTMHWLYGQKHQGSTFPRAEGIEAINEALAELRHA